MSLPLTLPVVLPENCATFLGESICNILAQIDTSFQQLSQLSSEIEKGVDTLLEERTVILQERQALQAEKSTLTATLQQIAGERGNESQAVSSANALVESLKADLERVNNELNLANADLANNAQEITKLQTQLGQMETTAKNTFQGIQNNLSATNNLLSGVTKKRKIGETLAVQQQNPVGDGMETDIVQPSAQPTIVLQPPAPVPASGNIPVRNPPVEIRSLEDGSITTVARPDIDTNNRRAVAALRANNATVLKNYLLTMERQGDIDDVAQSPELDTLRQTLMNGRALTQLLGITIDQRQTDKRLANFAQQGRLIDLLSVLDNRPIYGMA